MYLTEVYLFQYGIWDAANFLFIYFFGVSDLQNKHPDQVETQARDSESSPDTAQGWRGNESWRVVVVAGPVDTQLECVVS